MTGNDLLSVQDVAIFGLGLMGGSMALALRGKCRSITGIESDQHAQQVALDLNVVDQIFPFPPSRPVPASLVILAAPILTNIRILSELHSYCSGPAVVLDIGSTKTTTLRQMELLPDNFTPIGGHPMCGKEKKSIDHAEASLYQGAVFALSPLPRTTASAQELAQELVLALGSVPLWIDAATHDNWVAFTSHLPYLLANALASTTPPAASPLVGPGFKSTSRLAGSNLAMMMDILISNHDNVLSTLIEYQSNLQQIHDLLEHKRWDELKLLLEAGAEQRNVLVPL